MSNYQGVHFVREGVACDVVFGKRAPHWFGGQKLDKSSSNRVWIRCANAEQAIDIRARAILTKQWPGRPLQAYDMRFNRIKAGTQFTETFVFGHYSILETSEEEWIVPFKNRDMSGPIPFIHPKGHPIKMSTRHTLGTYRALSYYLFDPPGSGHSNKYKSEGSPLFYEPLEEFFKNVRWTG